MWVGDKGYLSLVIKHWVCGWGVGESGERWVEYRLYGLLGNG